MVCGLNLGCSMKGTYIYLSFSTLLALSLLITIFPNFTKLLKMLYRKKWICQRLQGAVHVFRKIWGTIRFDLTILHLDTTYIGGVSFPRKQIAWCYKPGFDVVLTFICLERVQRAYQRMRLDLDQSLEAVIQPGIQGTGESTGEQKCQVSPWAGRWELS